MHLKDFVNYYATKRMSGETKIIRSELSIYSMGLNKNGVVSSRNVMLGHLVEVSLNSGENHSL